MSAQPNPMPDLPPVTMEQVLLRIATQAFVMTAHLPKKKLARAFLLKSLEIGRMEAKRTQLSRRRTPAELAQINRSRSQALAVLEEYVPMLMSMASGEGMG